MCEDQAYIETARGFDVVEVGQGQVHLHRQVAFPQLAPQLHVYRLLGDLVFLGYGLRVDLVA